MALSSSDIKIVANERIAILIVRLFRLVYKRIRGLDVVVDKIGWKNTTVTDREVELW